MNTALGKAQKCDNDDNDYDAADDDGDNNNNKLQETLNFSS
jgi:hypothetical protein